METEKTEAGNQSILYLNVEDITPDPEQPRKHFDQEELESLAFTFKSQGIINPIEVDEHNVIVTGERRWRAAQIAGIKQVPCTIWSDDSYKRFERQLTENLHHGELTGREKEDAVVKLWETGKYQTMEALGKAVGLAVNSISRTLSANKFRKNQPEISVPEVSTYSISETAGLDTGVRVKILEALAKGKINSRDIREVKNIAQSSEALLDKTLGGTVSVKRAFEASETIQKIEDGGVPLEPEQKQRFADNLEKDQDLIKKYQGDVLDRVHRTMTTPKSEQENQSTPIGRTNPVTYIVTVKDEIVGNFRRHIGNCDTGERRWALKVLKEIQDEIKILIEVVSK